MSRADPGRMIKNPTIAYHPASDAGSLSLSNCTAVEDTTVLGPHGYTTLKVTATASTEIQVTWVNKSNFNPGAGNLFAVVRIPQSTTALSRIVLSTGAASLADNEDCLFNTNYIREGNGGNNLWNYLPIHMPDSPADTYSASGQIFTEYNAGVDPSLPILSGRFNFPSAVDTEVYYIEGIFYQAYGKTAITIGFDANGTDVGTLAKPLLTAKGWNGYQALENGAINSAALVARAQEQYADGWDILPHSKTHTDHTTLTDAQVLVEVDDSIDEIEGNGWKRGSRLYIYPGGTVDGDVCAAMGPTKAIAGFGAYGRHVTPSTAGLDNIYSLGRYELGGKTLAAAKIAVDAAIRYGASLHMYTHVIIPGADDPPVDTLEWAEDNFSALLDYIELKQNQGLVEVMSPSDWWEKYQNGNISRPTV